MRDVSLTQPPQRRRRRNICPVSCASARCNPVQLLADLATEEIYLRPTMRLADAVAAQGGNVYTYLFDWHPPRLALGHVTTLR